MQAKKRLSEVSVIQGLLDEPQRFQFVQAVRILVRWMAQNGVPPGSAFAHVLRFRNSLSLNFPSSEIEALMAGPEACATDANLLLDLQEGRMHIALTPAFLGLLGVTGALPLHKTGYIATAERWDGDASAHAFIDLLSNRMVGLFFQAWGKYRLEHKLDIEGQDGQLPLLMALAGIDHGALPDENDDGGTDHMQGYYAALLRTRPVSANTMSRVLTHHFGAPIELEPFVDAWDHIPDSKRSKLGGKVAKLGLGATLGGRLRRRDIRVRLNIGPVDKLDFKRFLPRSGTALALENMLLLFGLPNLDFEARLFLKSSCIEPLVLTSKLGGARRLGWDAFLVGHNCEVSRNTVAYLLGTRSGA